jgi:hypothetical protein
MVDTLLRATASSSEGRAMSSVQGLSEHDEPAATGHVLYGMAVMVRATS